MKVKDLVRNALILSIIHSIISIGMIIYASINHITKEIFMWSVALTIDIVTIIHLIILINRTKNC